MATYYISTTGNDTTGDGSSGNPWLTLSKANTASSDGDTIRFYAGTYTFATTSITKQIVIQGGFGGETIMTGASSDICWICTVNNIYIKNITFKDNTASNRTIMIGAGLTDYIYDCVFKNIQIESSFSRGVILLEDNATINIRRCKFIDIFSSGISAIVASNWTSVGNGNLYDNIVYFSTGKYINAILYANYDAPGTGNYVLKNNIFISRHTSSQSLYTSLISVSSLNNCYHNITTSQADSSDTTSDPLFFDEVNENFRIRPTSPCKEIGIIT